MSANNTTEQTSTLSQPTILRSPRVLVLSLLSGAIGLILVSFSMVWGLGFIFLAFGLAMASAHENHRQADQLVERICRQTETNNAMIAQIQRADEERARCQQELASHQADLADLRSDAIASRMELVSELEDLRAWKLEYDASMPVMSELFASLSSQISVATVEAERAVDVAISSFISLSQETAELSKVAFQGVSEESDSGNQRMELATTRVIMPLVDKMKADALAMEETAASSVQLTVIGNELEAILDQIQQIADRTGMLALNAQIEAARAGRDGQAFAIVAEEVGKLGIESKEAAERTRSLSKQMASASSTAAKKLRSAAEYSQAEVAAAEREVLNLFEEIHRMEQLNKSRLDCIASKSQSIADQVARITTAMQFQDMLRQRLAHVSAPLKYLAEGVNPTEISRFTTQDAPGLAPKLEVVEYGIRESDADVTLF